MTYENGVTTSYQYDNMSRPISIYAQKNDADILVMNYQYDPAGNVTGSNFGRETPYQEWVQSAESFQYDELDRLVLAQGDYGQISFTYDPVGNRLSRNDLNYSYNNMNELTSTDQGTLFTYDQNGNMLSRNDGTDSFSYAYNARNQLVQVEKNQQIISYCGYDGDGRRIRKTELVNDSGEYQTVIYVYSGNNAVYEKNLDTGLYATYVYGPSGRMAKKVGDVVDYYHQDRVQSTRLITDENGNPLTSVSYTPYGKSALTGEEEQYLYTGKEKDRTGLYFFGSRYYDPEIGRFITRDTMEGETKNPQSLNPYSYCANNPVRYIDPLGFGNDDPWSVVWQIFQHLSNMSLEDLDDIIHAESDDERFALLADIVQKLGFECSIDYENKEIEITIEVNGLSTKAILYNEEMECCYGMAPPGSPTNEIRIDVEDHNTVAELASTILHEISHRALELACPDIDSSKHHNYIYPIQLEFIDKVIANAKGFPDHHSPCYPFSTEYVLKKRESLELFCGYPYQKAKDENLIDLIL
jgi:RHS repeat-associated protein